MGQASKHVLVQCHVFELRIVMFFASEGIQSAGRAKANEQLAAAEQRLSEVTAKLSKATVVNRELRQINKKEKTNKDWTASYTNWNQWEDVEDLEIEKLKEEGALEAVVNKKEALGHYHDHSKERAFYELPEDKKFAACEENRMLGNYLYREGVYPKAAERYQIAIAYYEYCFVEDECTQQRLDDLKHACLCNISLCYQKMGYLRQAVESVSSVIKETNGTHSKAYFRRAQAYRQLDEYDLAVENLKSARALTPGDRAIAAELELIKKLSKNYTHSQREFARNVLDPDDSSTSDGITTGSGSLNNTSTYDVTSCSIFESSMPLEPVLPDDIRQFNQKSMK